MPIHDCYLFIMGLSQYDLEKVPKDLTVKDCYKRIYQWHKMYGEEKIQHKNVAIDYKNAYLAFLTRIPDPANVSREDMNLVFDEVITMLLEWSYHEPDEYGIKIAAYAHRAIEIQYGNYNGYANQDFIDSMHKSSLYPEFGGTNWKNKYKK